MNYLFCRLIPTKPIIQPIFRNNQFLPTYLRCELKLVKYLVFRACSNTTNEESWNTTNEFTILRSIMRRNEKYHVALIDLQLEKHPEKFKILDDGLLSALEDCFSSGNKELQFKRISLLGEKLKNCDTSDIFKVLAFCVNMNGRDQINSNSKNYSFLRKIDKVFTKKLDSLNINEVMLMADAWTIMHLFKKKCPNLILERLMRQLHRLEDFQVVYTFYLLSKLTKTSSIIDHFTMQGNLIPRIGDLSVEELTIIAVGLYRSQIEISNKEFRRAFFDKVTLELNNVPQEIIIPLLKVTRLSMTRFDCLSFGRFQERIIPQVHRLPPITLPRVISLGNASRTYNKNLVAECVKYVKPVIQELRLKDLEKILFTVSVFYYKDSKLINMIVEELKTRTDERNSFPIVFASCVYDLVMIGVFPLEWIKFCLEPEMIRVVQKKKRHLLLQLAWIDAAAKLEIPDYDGPYLPAETWKAIPNDNEDHLELTKTKKFISYVDHSLKEIYGKKKVTRKILLPYYDNEFSIVGFDHKLKPIHPPQEWVDASNNADTFTYAPDDTNFWVVAQIIGYSHESQYNRKLLAVPRVIKRHLIKLGYCVAQFQYSSWLSASGDKKKLRLIKRGMECEVKQARKKN